MKTRNGGMAKSTFSSNSSTVETFKINKTICSEQKPHYNAEEEEKFLKGLELYGNDWSAISKFMGSRDSRSVQKHARKHFLKVEREKYVRKSPTSSRKSNIHTSKPAEANEESENSCQNRKRKAIKRYVMSSQNLSLCKCIPYDGMNSKDCNDKQPFSLKVSKGTLIVSIFHAHLLSCEIIGFLAGKWNSELKCLEVLAAYPCKEIVSSRNSVEMDPIAELEVRASIQKDNLVIVGWYHSHPTFEPDPSIIDIENQNNYQLLFSDEKSRVDPFVGLIVTPYDDNESGISLNWFHVSFADGKPTPRKLGFSLEHCGNSDLFDIKIADQCCKLYDSLICHKSAFNLDEKWRKSIDQSRIERILQTIYGIITQKDNKIDYDFLFSLQKVSVMLETQLIEACMLLKDEERNIFSRIFGHTVLLENESVY